MNDVIGVCDIPTTNYQEGYYPTYYYTVPPPHIFEFIQFGTFMLRVNKSSGETWQLEMNTNQWEKVKEEAITNNE